MIQTLIPDFSPEKCEPELAQYGIDCKCPLAIKAGLVDLVNEVLGNNISTFVKT